ncbi:MAG TPA: cyclic nucleotide-binding domain-containing protein [bacterium]|nr:cyclic nucleotide-binding domain-containing protein [bacterium]
MLSGYAKWRHTKASHAIRTRFKVALIEKVPLFAGLSKREFSQIAGLVDEVEAPAGTRLATIGEAGHELFIIVEGEARVTTQPGRTASLRAGDFFGEMSLLDGEPRSATVEASTPIRLLVLGHREFWQLLDRTASLVHKIMHALCQRVRHAEKSVLDVKGTSVRA